jgi:exopolysaccharide biosynthesis polyprenyl glycosylphosphotransferase
MSTLGRAYPGEPTESTPRARRDVAHGSRVLGSLTAALDERTLEILRHRGGHGARRRRGWFVRRALLAADLIGLTIAFSLSESVYVGVPDVSNTFGRSGEYAVFFGTLPLWVVAARVYGLYDKDEARANHDTTDDVVRVFHLVTIVAWLLIAGSYLSHLADPAVTKVVLFWLIAVPAVTLFRAGARALSRRQFSYLQNTVIVGAGDVGQALATKILRHREYGLNLVGFIDDEPKEPRPGLEGLTILGSPERLAEIVETLDVERVIVAFSNDATERTIGLVRSLHDFDVQIDVVPRLFDLVGPSSEIHTLEGVPLLAVPSLRLSRSSKAMKRAMDVALASLSMLVLAPVFLAIAVAVKLDTPGPVLFRQRRMGTGGEHFRILKFRTMSADAEERKAALGHLNKHAQPGNDPRMFKIPDDPRVTGVGRFLRRHSLDELPQLVNVLRGEMSLVGPRPLILEESRHIDTWARKRMDIKPGITGLWQVLGRSDIPFEEMVKLDYLYVTTWSLWQDVRLLFRTVPVVAAARGGSY